MTMARKKTGPKGNFIKRGIKSFVNTPVKTDKKSKAAGNKKTAGEKRRDRALKDRQKAREKNSKKSVKKIIGGESLKTAINKAPELVGKTSVNPNEVYYKVTGGKPKVALTPLKQGRYGYSIQSVRSSVPKEDRSKEYSRLMSVVKKRVKSFERAGIQSQQIKDIKKSIRNIDKLSKNESRRDQQLVKGIVEFNKFLSHETSSVRGYKQDANEWIKKMRHEVKNPETGEITLLGYDVNQYNYHAVIDALEYLSTVYKGLIYDSDQIVEIAIQTVNDRMKKDGDRFFSKYNSSSYRSSLRREVIERYEEDTDVREEFAQSLRTRNNNLF